MTDVLWGGAQAKENAVYFTVGLGKDQDLAGSAFKTRNVSEAAHRFWSLAQERAEIRLMQGVDGQNDALLGAQ
jgi:hypothetical protein